ncbi:MAG: DinB family protein, partial [Ignavibacteriales bacterium]
HVEPLNVLQDLTLETAGKVVKNSPYTVWQILKHINYWQERFISYIKDEFTEPTLKAEIGWAFPQSPSDQEELYNEIKKLNDTLVSVKKLSEDELNKKAQNYQTGYDVLQAMASHISYHLGEIVLLRRIIGSWPPPSGGDTW